MVNGRNKSLLPQNHLGYDAVVINGNTKQVYNQQSRSDPIFHHDPCHIGNVQIYQKEAAVEVSLTPQLFTPSTQFFAQDAQFNISHVEGSNKTK